MEGNGIFTGEELELLRKNQKANNGSGLYRVHKYNNDCYRRGFAWRYVYPIGGGCKRNLTCTTLDGLKRKVEDKGLDWRVVNKVRAEESYRKDKINVHVLNGGRVDVDIDNLIREYKDGGKTVRELCAAYGLTRNQFQKIIRDNTSFRRNKGAFNKRFAKYYTEKNGRFVVQRGNVYYGTYNYEDDAKRVVDCLKKCDWDKSKLKEIRREWDL